MTMTLEEIAKINSALNHLVTLLEPFDVEMRDRLIRAALVLIAPKKEDIK